ncbi:MAG: ADP-ribosylglycohydrolase family protein [Acidobacteriota bacterium]
MPDLTSTPKLIGVWMHSLDDVDLPPPQELVGDVPEPLRRELADYLDAGEEFCRYRCCGTPCLFGCGHAFGNRELTDGVWVWPDDLGHYVWDHGVRLPEAFIGHVRRHRSPKIEGWTPPDFPDADPSEWIAWCARERSHALSDHLRAAEALAKVRAHQRSEDKATAEEWKRLRSRVECQWAGCSRRSLAGLRLCAYHLQPDFGRASGWGLGAALERWQAGVEWRPDPGPDRFAGCLLGLAVGDALGAGREGGWLERGLWLLIGRTLDGRRRFTDDTQMALDMGSSLLEERELDVDALATGFAASYVWRRGYGPGAARVLKRIRAGESWRTASRAVYPEGSFGNGAAMRSPVLPLFFHHDPTAMVKAARASAMITHAHPLGVDGAVVIAVATRAALLGGEATTIGEEALAASETPEMRAKLDLVASWTRKGEASAAPEVTPREIRQRLGRGVAAVDSCPTAICLALRHLDQPFQTMLDLAIKIGGDVDTIAAMAGAIWGAANGAERLPPIHLESRLDITSVALDLFTRAV